MPAGAAQDASRRQPRCDPAQPFIGVQGGFSYSLAADSEQAARELLARASAGPRAPGDAGPKAAGKQQAEER
jgi:hypothetical protein